MEISAHGSKRCISRYVINPYVIIFRTFIAIHRNAKPRRTGTIQDNRLVALESFVHLRIRTGQTIFFLSYFSHTRLFHISDFLTSFRWPWLPRGSLPSQSFRFRIRHGLLNCLFFKLECETRARIAYVNSSPAYRLLWLHEVLAAG